MYTKIKAKRSYDKRCVTNFVTQLLTQLIESTFRRHGASVPPEKRIKRSADANYDDKNDQIEYQRVPNVMKQLLRVSRAIETIEMNILSRENDEVHLRRKRNTANQTEDDFIQVSHQHVPDLIQSPIKIPLSR